MPGQYSFPIFISSTEYNLVDLRAELSRYLLELGYTPFVSSQEGFPNYTPQMTPWESCLKVLESSFIVILIIDKRYGSQLDWTEYKDIVGDKISPTHGEYRMARHLKKKLLVFCRDDIDSAYQIYKKHLSAEKGDKAKAAAAMKDMLPPGMQIETLEFYNEVKISPDIPWIKSFKNVVDIKSEIQSQLVNQLAISHMEKQQTLETVIAAFQTAVSELSPSKQTAVLKKVGLTRELLRELNERKDEADKLKAEIEKLNNKMKRARSNERKETIYITASKLKEQLFDVNKQISFEKSGLVDRMDEANPKHIDLSNWLTYPYEKLSGDAVTNLFSPKEESPLDLLSNWKTSDPGLWDGVLLKKQDDVIWPTLTGEKKTTYDSFINQTNTSEQLKLPSSKKEEPAQEKDTSSKTTFLSKNEPVHRLIKDTLEDKAIRKGKTSSGKLKNKIKKSGKNNGK